MDAVLKSPTLIEEIIFRAMKSLQDEKAAHLAYCKEMNLPIDSISDELKVLDRKMKICAGLLKEC